MTCPGTGAQHLSHGMRRSGLGIPLLEPGSRTFRDLPCLHWGGLPKSAVQGQVSGSSFALPRHIQWSEPLAPPRVPIGECRIGVRETDRMNDTMTSRQAFEAMRVFLARFNENEPVENRRTIDLLLHRTKVEEHSRIIDPTQWADWELAVIAAGGFSLPGRCVPSRSAQHSHAAVAHPTGRPGPRPQGTR